MLNEFTISRGKAMINFSLKYCDNRQKLLNSYGFKKVIDSFIQVLKKDNVIIYDYYIKFFNNKDDEFAQSLVQVFKFLTVCDEN